MTSATRRPTPAQAELLTLLRQGWRIRAAGYMVSPQGRPQAGYVNRKTLQACRTAGWVVWTTDGWAAR
jgi:hypothetical protein